jgi:hypothetical protein
MLSGCNSISPYDWFTGMIPVIAGFAKLGMNLL